MTTPTLYGLTKCSTCVKARNWLQERGVDAAFVDYRDHPLPAADLLKWSTELGGWEKLVNRASMTWRNLPEDRKAAASDEQWQALIAEFPALVRRPLAVWPDGSVTVGFTEKKYLERLGG
ncbi:Spx/MgsR family RNA polymerase-binding regulatory protein [Achromobacter sp. F4_2707]|uniref:Spx/MgsR family RNA polymerase-binding regulatory protein n=1 Tax=Achromobacter sp. F4_2707 TaxID=3114286 RepID=UPI0039C629F6